MSNTRSRSLCIPQINHNWNRITESVIFVFISSIFAESRSLCQPCCHSGKSGDYAGYWQDCAGRVRLHGRGPNGQFSSHRAWGWWSGWQRWWHQRDVSFNLATMHQLSNAVRGRSQTTLTKFCPLLTSYPHVYIFDEIPLWTKERSAYHWHFQYHLPT